MFFVCLHHCRCVVVFTTAVVAAAVVVFFFWSLSLLYWSLFYFLFSLCYHCCVFLSPPTPPRLLPSRHCAHIFTSSSPEVDVWSCGVILYALLCGSLPFDDESIPNLFKKIKGGMYSLPSHLSQLSKELIPQMLRVDPTKRISMQHIREHQWFQVSSSSSSSKQHQTPNTNTAAKTPQPQNKSGRQWLVPVVVRRK